MHFRTFVFTETASKNEAYKLLEPYYNEYEVEPYILYTKEECIQNAKRERETLEKSMEKARTNKDFKPCWWLKSDGTMHEREKELLSLRTDEQFYQFYVAHCYNGDFDKNGNEMCTANPNVKWDYCRILGNDDEEDEIQEGDTDEFVLVKNLPKYHIAKPYAFLTKDSKWFDCDDFETELYKKMLDEYIANNPDLYVSVFDCHI